MSAVRKTERLSSLEHRPKYHPSNATHSDRRQQPRTTALPGCSLTSSSRCCGSGCSLFSTESQITTFKKPRSLVLRVARSDPRHLKLDRTLLNFPSQSTESAPMNLSSFGIAVNLWAAAPKMAQNIATTKSTFSVLDPADAARPSSAKGLMKPPRPFADTVTTRQVHRLWNTSCEQGGRPDWSTSE